MDPLGQVLSKAFTLRTLVGSGLIRPMRADKLARLALTMARWGPTPAAGYSASVMSCRSAGSSGLVGGG